MKKETRKKLCKNCQNIMRQEDTENKRAYRLKIKEVEKQVSGKVAVRDIKNK